MFLRRLDKGEVSLFIKYLGIIKKEKNMKVENRLIKFIFVQ